MTYGLFDPAVAWWDRELGDPEIGRGMLETVMDIERRQSSIHDGNQRHARIYAGYLPSGLTPGAAPTASVRTPFAATKALIRSICDTAHAMIVRNRPKSSIVTDGGDWKVQTQAEDLEQFLLGAFHAGKLFEVSPRSFHDSTVFGTGGWKYVPTGSGEKFRVNYERVIIDDIIVDEESTREDCFVQPEVYHRMLVRTDALVRKYASDDPELRMKLMASRPSGWSWPGLHVAPDRSVLVEGIHIDPEHPSNNRRVLSVDNVVLKSEHWAFPFQPYTFLWWNLPVTGFYGDGIAYRQYGRQERVTYMHRWISKVFDQFATPTAWVDPIGGPPSTHLSNDIGKVVLTRRPPVFQSQPLIQGEVYNWLNKLETDGYEDEGMNQSMTQGAVQPGMESAPAQREAVWREGQRFFPVSQRWEFSVAVDTAYKTAAMYKRAAESGTPPRVQWADRKLMYTMEWPDLDDSHYMIRPEASSLDSLSPSARTQSALELAQTTWITPQEGRALIAHPDLKASDDLGNAAETYAKWVLRKLWKGEAVQVDEKAELGALMRVVKQGRLLAITRNVEEKAPEILNNMDRFVESLDTAMQAAAEAAKQKAMADQMAMQPSPGMNTPPIPAEGAPTPGMGQ